MILKHNLTPEEMTKLKNQRINQKKKKKIKTGRSWKEHVMVVCIWLSIILIGMYAVWF